MSFLSCVVLAMLGAWLPQTAAATPGPSQLLGTWRGTSICVDRVAAPACTDETAVYEFTAGAKAGTVHWKAGKVVNGTRQEMGEAEMAYDASEACWKAEISGPRLTSAWRMAVSGAHLTGTARLLPGNATVRTLDLRKEAGTAVLFIGNSFTFGAGSPVQSYRPDSVTDLNHEGIGGVPALFKSFTRQAGLDYDVFLETHPGIGLDYHLQNKADVLGSRPWDEVVMHGQSTLDFDKPGDPAKLIATARQMAEFLIARNPKVRIHLTSTWSRADQTYVAGGRWYGQPIEAMARDLRAAYDQAAATSPAIKSVIPVGEAWTRAIRAGIADPNPYDGITPGQIDLWTRDHYHASTQGYYLEALMVFGDLTGRDPRSLGEQECSAFELDVPPAQVKALQQVAFDQLAAAKKIAPNPRATKAGSSPARCTP
jgi:hypothetical protein